MKKEIIANLLKEALKKQIGVVGVDSGTLWLGDPSYILHQDKPPKAFGKNYAEFTDKLKGGYQQHKFDKGHDGLGVTFSTGFGDGTYPVHAEIDENNRIKSITVEFINRGEAAIRSILKEKAKNASTIH